MNKLDKVIKLYKGTINGVDCTNKKTILVFKKLLKSFSIDELRIAFFNFKNSRNYKSGKKYYPTETFLTTKHVKFWLDFTNGLDVNDEKTLREIKTAESMFVRFYNNFIRKDYQEYFYKKFDFINFSYKYAEEIRQAVTFFIINKNKMYNIYRDRIEYERMMFVFVATLFYVFSENPPKVFQYYREEELFNWMKENSGDLFELYDIWNSWGWLKTLNSFKFSDNDINELNEKRKHIQELEKLPVPENVVKILKGNFTGAKNE